MPTQAHLRWKFANGQWECWREFPSNLPSKQIASVKRMGAGRVEVHYLEFSSNSWERMSPQTTVRSAKALIARRYGGGLP